MDFPTLRPQAHIQHSALILVSSQQKHLTAHSLHYSPRNSSPTPCHDWPVKNHSVSRPSRVCLARLPTNGWCNIGRTSTHRATQAYPLDLVRHCNSYIRSTGIHWSPGMQDEIVKSIESTVSLLFSISSAAPFCDAIVLVCKEALR
jgi:hypothetical protein